MVNNTLGAEAFAYAARLLPLDSAPCRRRHVARDADAAAREYDGYDVVDQSGRIFHVPIYIFSARN